MLPSSSAGNPIDSDGSASSSSSPLSALSVFLAISRRISPPLTQPSATRVSTGSALADLANPRKRRLPRLIPYSAATQYSSTAAAAGDLIRDSTDATAPPSISAARPSLQPARLHTTIIASLANPGPCVGDGVPPGDTSSLSDATESSARTTPGALAIFERLAPARER
ncbi:unnamed protein product [Musa acuminata subsp. burmannicoides]